MVYDEIVIGSGLSALGVLLGLDSGRRVLVLAGPQRGIYSHYNSQQTVPCAYLGAGGLGNDWHGVIPMGLHRNFGAATDAEFISLFARFYPRSALSAHLRQDQLFVPWKPIRSWREITQVALERPNLKVQAGTVSQFELQPNGVTVRADGVVFTGRRLWLASGPLHTPRILEKSLGGRFSRPYVSDHAVCYVGVLENHPAPRITRTRDGVFFQCFYDTDTKALYTLRPARFAFRRLDYGFEQRAVFGMPTGNIIAKILRRMSPGLLVEAFYNRVGAFAAAKIYSVYAQTAVADGYALHAESQSLEAREESILRATALARMNAPFARVQLSRRPELYIPGIHLHHSIDVAALARAGVGDPHASVQVVDASTISDIGPDHHSFKLLLMAHRRARFVAG